MKTNILITGGNGLLGKKLQERFPNAFWPTSSELDITEPFPCLSALLEPFATVIHCAAVKTVACDRDPHQAMKTNIVGTAHVVDFCHSTKAKMVYISTDYVFKGDKGDYAPTDEVLPQNYYAETKLAGEYVVKCLPKYLIVRLSFFPDKFPYESAFIDQWTTRVTVSEAAREIAELVRKDATGIHHICGPKRTVYKYALATNGGKSVKPIKLADHDFKRPRDTSLVHEAK